MMARPGGDRGSIEHVNELGSFLGGGFEADAEPPRLEVGAIGSAGDFRVFAAVAATGHPRFQIVFAVGWTAKLAGVDVKHSIGNLESLEELLLDAKQFLMNRFALIGQRKREHFDFRELMNPKQAAGSATLPRLQFESSVKARRTWPATDLFP